MVNKSYRSSSPTIKIHKQINKQRIYKLEKVMISECGRSRSKSKLSIEHFQGKSIKGRNKGNRYKIMDI